MPRQSRSSRPAPRAAPPQTRGAATMAAPPVTRAAVPPATATAAQGQAKQPGLMAQMAATAGSVAIGSTIGHGLSNMLFGGGSAAAAPEAQQAASTMQQAPASCDLQVKEFTKCLENNDVGACSWYMEQLKACQAAARPY